MRYSILVPFYNEVDNVEPMHREIVEAMDAFNSDYEMIFVNDGSTDGTTEELDMLAEKDKRAKVLHFARNFGQTAAVSAAIDASRGEILIGMDGDRQNDPRDIPALVSKLNEGFDVVSGWRKDRKDKALTRRLPSVIANKLISYVSGVSLNDYGCSLKAYRRDVISDVRLYGEMHRFIPIYTSWAGGRIAEMAVNHRARVAGTSKYGLRRVWKVLMDLLVVKFLDKFLVKPIHFFGGCAAFVLICALLTGLWAIGLKLFVGTSFVSTPLPLLTVVLLLVAVLLVVQGLLAEIMTRSYFEGQGKTAYSIKTSRNLEV